MRKRRCAAMLGHRGCNDDAAHDKPHTDEELAEVIAYLKGVWAKWEADNAAAIARGLPPIPPPFNWTKAQVGKCEAKVAQREAKAAAKAAKRAARKRDPRQLEETPDASLGDAEKDVPQC